MSHVPASKVAGALRTNRETHCQDLSSYFTLDYTGSHFEFLPGCTDRVSAMNEIMADDILATTLLGVNFPGTAVLELLEGSAGTLVATQLALIPFDQDLHSFSSNPIGVDSPAWVAWNVIAGLDDVKRTKTSKLLARKRPRLLPILDDVVVCALKLGDTEAWKGIYEILTDNDVSVVGELLAIQTLASPNHPRIAELSLLRVLDIVVWMEHKQDHSRKSHKPSAFE
jgi:hypothetical protein